MWTWRVGKPGDWEWVCALPRVKLIASGNLLQSTGSLAQCSVTQWVGWRGESEGESWEEREGGLDGGLDGEAG